MRKAESFGDMIQRAMVARGYEMAAANAVCHLRSNGWDEDAILLALPAVSHCLEESSEWLFAQGVRASQEAFDSGLQDLSAFTFSIPYLRAGQLIAQVVAKNGIEPPRVEGKPRLVA